jgi:hypothetical protein
MKKSRKLSIVLAVIYLILVAGATVYCQITYYAKLPTAYLAKPVAAEIDYDGNIPKSLQNVPDGKYPDAVPRTCLSDDGTGKMKVNMIEEKDGPWGKRYYIRQTDTVYWPVDSASKYILIFWRLDDSFPIAADIDTGYAYEGMEVKLDRYEQQ